ncbi:MAG TPA: TonB family protein [Terriglobales bacterium]|nr:TonB family protein [Terriglobales bacterium]
MATRVLLLCGEEKAVHAVARILDELELSFEHSSDSAFSLKRLANQRFDLLIVDCDNAPTATQVFNSARSSPLNKTAITIAIVEGKAGVPNAFRLGASLVLTKPVSLEQARNTLRAALGMIQKDSEAKPASSMAAAGASTITSAVPVVAPAAPAIAVPAPVPPANSAPTASPVASAAPPVPAPPAAMPPASPTPLPFESAKEAAGPAPALAPASGDKLSASVRLPNPTFTREAKPALTDFSESPSSPLPKDSDLDPKLATDSPALGKLNSSLNCSRLETNLAKSKPELAKAEVPEWSDGMLPAVEHFPADETGETPQTLRNGAVPSFGGLAKRPFAGIEKRKSRPQAVLVAALILVLMAAGGYAAWRTQPGFHNLVGGGYTKVRSLMGRQPQAAVAPKPQPAPDQPAPVPSATQPQPELNQTATAPSQTPAGNPEDASTPIASTVPALTANAPNDGHEGDRPTMSSDSAQNAKAATAPSRSGAAKSVPVLSAASNTPATTRTSSELLEVPEDYADDQVIHRVHPVYPRQARLKKLKGTVVLEAIVNKQGKVDSLQLLSGDPILAQAAYDAVKQWRYKPYSHNGEPSEFQTRVTVDFKLP